MTHERYIAELEAYLLSKRKADPTEAAAGPEHSEDAQGRRSLTDEAVEKIRIGMGLRAEAAIRRGEFSDELLDARPPACPHCGSGLVMLTSRTSIANSVVDTRQVACIRACVFGPLSSDEKLAVEAWNNFHLNGGNF